MLLLPEHVCSTTVELKRATAFLQSESFCCMFLSTFIILKRKKSLIARQISLLIKKG